MKTQMEDQQRIMALLNNVMTWRAKLTITQMGMQALIGAGGDIQPVGIGFDMPAAEWIASRLNQAAFLEDALVQACMTLGPYAQQGSAISAASVVSNLAGVLQQSPCGASFEELLGPPEKAEQR